MCVCVTNLCVTKVCVCVCEREVAWKRDVCERLCV